MQVNVRVCMCIYIYIHTHTYRGFGIEQSTSGLALPVAPEPHRCRDISLQDQMREIRRHAESAIAELSDRACFAWESAQRTAEDCTVEKQSVRCRLAVSCSC